MLVRQVRRKLFTIGLLEATELFAIWKIMPDGQVRRTVLSRDRRDTGSLVSADESSTRPSRVSQKSAQKCQHEENRSATNARECNWYDHGRCYFPWTKRPRRCLTDSSLSAIPAIPRSGRKLISLADLWTSSRAAPFSAWSSYCLPRACGEFVFLPGFAKRLSQTARQSFRH